MENIADINTILQKAINLRGYSLKQLSDHLNITTPKSMISAKGLTGQIIEYLLGATARSKPLPDFPELNLEIKTIPIDLKSQVLETTYVCSAQLLPHQTNYQFKSSIVYKKLQHVLWLPIIVPDPQTDVLNNRIIGNAFLWQPDHEQLKLLETDWLELSEMLMLGNIESLSSHYGQILQIRPKAANSKAITAGLNLTGNKIATIPRGFYLRKHFTQTLF